MLRWHFREKRTGDDISDPITGEFFADGSLDNPSTALVREALQNALDAGKEVDRQGKPVKVRISLQRRSHAVPAAAASAWFSSLQEHLNAPGNGLRDQPADGESCDYLVVEDFGTSGLTGDTESDSADGARNNFVDFLRSDGRTRKAAGDRGSWGVGKNVFPRSSRINSFIAFTVRRDDGRQLVMGKSILKIRSVRRAQFQPSCYLGSSWEPDEVPRPYEDESVVKTLRRDFHVTRETEPGLSIVVPWLDPDVKYHDLFDAVVRQFYFAILNNSLSVDLENNEDKITLAADNLLETVRAMRPDYSPAIELAQWSLSEGAIERHQLEPPHEGGPQKWSSELVPEVIREAIVVSLTQRQRLAVRVPLHVQEAGSRASQPTFFDVFLEHHDGEKNLAPAFFREQLAISGVKRAVGVPKIRALVVIDHTPLANLLRAAEPPNHTDWDLKTANFRNQYRDGNHVITFVKTAVKQLMTHVRAGTDEPDATIAIDFFGIPEPDTTPGGKRDSSKKGTEPPKKFEGLESTARPYTVQLVDGGFAIRATGAASSMPERILVAAAYDVLSGSAWKLYESADFDLTRRDRSGLSISADGDVQYRVLEPNRLELKLSGSDFDFRVTGFDPNRDVIVRAYHRKEVPGGDTAAELHEEEEAQA